GQPRARYPSPRAKSPGLTAMTEQAGPILRTERLILRPWRDEDVAAFVRLNGDPEVMAQTGGTRTAAVSEVAARSIRDPFDRHGFGVWAVELPGGESFIGFIGLARADFEAPFTPCVEIGWRLARAHWGLGYATEGARAALDFGFRQLDVDEIVAYTHATNLRSRRVMEKLGMSHRAEDDFDF